MFAYSKGITSSREMQWSCETHIIFKALSCDTVPHFTTLASFVSRHADEIEALFEQVLLVCHEQGLLGNELFAIVHHHNSTLTTDNGPKQEESLERTMTSMVSTALRWANRLRHGDACPLFISFRLHSALSYQRNVARFGSAPGKRLLMLVTVGREISPFYEQ
nr:transposase [Halomonas sp.]